MLKNFEETKAYMNSCVSMDTGRKEAWSKVKLNKKKDGTDFAQLNRSFTGATVGNYYPVENWFNPYLTIEYEYVNENGRLVTGTDHMEIYSDNFAEGREERRQYGISNWVLTPDEIMEKVNARIKMFEESELQHQNEYNHLEEIYNKYIPAIKTMMQELKEETNNLKLKESMYNTSLYYALKECAESTIVSSY